MARDISTLRLKRDQLIERIRHQAQLHLEHDVQACRSIRNRGNRWLFRCGMNQGIESGTDFFLRHVAELKSRPCPVARLLHEHRKEVIDTCLLWPHRAIERWGLTELIDRVDTEREDIIKGLMHGLGAVAHHLPRLIAKHRQNLDE